MFYTLVYYIFEIYSISPPRCCQCLPILQIYRGRRFVSLRHLFCCKLVYRDAIMNCIWFKSLDCGYTWALLNTTRLQVLLLHSRPFPFLYGLLQVICVLNLCLHNCQVSDLGFLVSEMFRTCKSVTFPSTPTSISGSSSLLFGDHVASSVKSVGMLFNEADS